MRTMVRMTHPTRRLIGKAERGNTGMDAIYEFEVVNMPVTVAVDAQGRKE